MLKYLGQSSISIITQGFGAVSSVDSAGTPSYTFFLIEFLNLGLRIRIALNADPDPAFHFNADSIQLFNLMRIRILLLI
jgi:hypothetical protein